MEAGNFPKIGVSALIRRHDQVLLVQRAKDPYKGYWSLPGGMVEFGEKLRDAALRECHEETGIIADLEAAPTAIFELILTDKNIQESAPRHIVLVMFCGKEASGQLRAADDAADVCWVLRDQLWQYEMTPDSLQRIYDYWPAD